MRREVGAYRGFLCAPVLSKNLLHVPASLAGATG